MAEARAVRGDAEVEGVSAAEERRRVAEGRALLVCAYEDEGKCKRLKLEGAHTLREVERALRGGVEAWQRAGYPMAA